MCGSAVVLLLKTQTHELRDGTKQGQSFHSGLLLSFCRCSNVTHITGPRNHHKVSLPHRAAPSQPSFMAHCHQRGHAAACMPKWCRLEIALVCRGRSRNNWHQLCHWTWCIMQLHPEFLPLVSCPHLKVQKRWVRWWGRVNVKKQSAALLPEAYQRWQDGLPWLLQTLARWTF